ncbi:retropepsin-like aspartic protease [Pedobacter sp. KR3-3]|uniref:Retropepsin-like aspartic protease n=1 Tax=Pedobacter albus TaxID=3113905 RepID=A0ABU7I5D9_9SPHI|nr:retropepsin-like aspartic protease [Pedobacter sp. KR3-3]MEE1944686.1 retropepsin-like aspartic protease [Pedobacter sp. KR3-3]
MKRIYRASFCLLFCLFSISALAQSKADALIKQLNLMFKHKNADTLQSSLSADFSIAAYTMPYAQKLLETIVAHYPCDSVQLQSEGKQDKLIRLNVIPYNKGKADKAQVYMVDEQYKLCYAAPFDALYGMNRDQVSKLRAKIPFELDNGSIILSIRLNNQTKPLKMLFDTGADGMAITKAKADSLGIKANRSQNASVVGGNLQIVVSEGNTVMLDTFVFKNQSIALFPEVKGNYDGIIGNAMAKRYITHVDFDKKELSLYDFGDYQYRDKGISVPVTLPNGLFIITGVLGVGNGPLAEGNFVFDTGAAYSLICFRPFVKQHKLLVNGFKSEYHGSTTSMGITTPTYSGRAASFAFRNMPKLLNYPVTLMAGGGQSENWNPGFDGSIGVRTISRYNFTINMQAKEIHFVPNSSINHPYDFVLGNYLFGFDNAGGLSVLAIVKPTENATLQVKQRIYAINGVSASILLNNAKQLEALLALQAGSPISLNINASDPKQTIILNK